MSTKLNPFFVDAMGGLVRQIRTEQIIEVYLDNLVCIKHQPSAPYGWTPKKITESVPYKCLQGETEKYKEYTQKFGTQEQSLECFYKLKKSIEDNGYPYNNDMIVIFGDEPYIRDGQNRAAILRYLYGNIKVQVLKLLFNKSFMGWQMPK